MENGLSDIAVVVMTFDRSPRQNYLGATFKNFARAGVLGSRRRHSLHVVDSGSPNLEKFLKEQNIPPGVEIHAASPRRVARENIAEALRVGAEHAPWVLFCEDDIDVCDNFLDSVGAWLDDHGHMDFKLFAFGAAYQQIQLAFARGYTYWPYLVEAFYGTQCFAMRRVDAWDLSEWLFTHRLIRGVDAPNAYDIGIGEWSETRWPNHPNFVASVPNFVQHLGAESSINTKNFFTFPAFPGHGWQYQSRAVRV